MSKWSVGFGLLTVLGLVAGCGQSQTNLTSKFMTVDSSNQSVTLNVTGSYSQTNDYMNFDGYANGGMTITVPLGYKVTIHYYNNGGIPADIGIYNNKNELAFQGAGDSINDISLNPQAGILPSTSETVTFTANSAGTFKLANFENYFPQVKSHFQDVGMWDWFKVVQSGTPSISAS